jgi:GTP-binding protein
MRFVDQVRVCVEAGRGGDGAIAWRREKYVPRGGPAGGDGGDGGDVVLVGDRSLTTLLELRYRQHLKAKSGQPGGTRDKNGRSADSLEIRVPIGTVVYVEGEATPGAPPPWITEKEEPTGTEPDEGMENVYVIEDDRDPAEIHLGLEEWDEMPEIPERGTVLGDITEHDQRLVVARGGKGGRGNIHFRSSTNRAPDQAEPGTPGQSMWIRLELKLLADVGIVGFPNVGKSTLISRISRARPKIGAYPFTTLVPQLGVVSLGEKRSFVVADVPGLIEGASEGKGLGHQFLRHLERTQVLVHVLAPDLDPDRDLLEDLDTIEDELTAYGPGFEGRPRVVAINKIDAMQDEEGQARIAELRRALRQRNIPLFPISAHTGEGVDTLMEAVWRRVAFVRGEAAGVK